MSEETLKQVPAIDANVELQIWQAVVSWFEGQVHGVIDFFTVPDIKGEAFYVGKEHRKFLKPKQLGQVIKLEEALNKAKWDVFPGKTK